MVLGMVGKSDIQDGVSFFIAYKLLGNKTTMDGVVHEPGKEKKKNCYIHPLSKYLLNTHHHINPAQYQ